jgi:SNF2 family DNA or RNA helicase
VFVRISRHWQRIKIWERQNSVEELFSLIKFLQIRPLNDWHEFNDKIAKPVKSGRSVRAMKRLHVCLITKCLSLGAHRYQVVLEVIMLRRRKDQIINGKPILSLPARQVEIVHCDFNASERKFYDAVQSRVEDSLDRMMGQEKRSYTTILLLLLRLRQGEFLSKMHARASCVSAYPVDCI